MTVPTGSTSSLMFNCVIFIIVVFFYYYRVYLCIIICVIVSCYRAEYIYFVIMCWMCLSDIYCDCCWNLLLRQTPRRPASAESFGSVAVSHIFEKYYFQNKSNFVGKTRTFFLLLWWDGTSNPIRFSLNCPYNFHQLCTFQFEKY